MSKERLEFIYKHPKTGEIKTIVLSKEEIRKKLEFHEEIELTCDCEPVGETNVVECNCQDYIEEFEYICTDVI